MRCLYKECPMSGRESCPAGLKCPEYRRTMTLKSGNINTELSPEEAVKAFAKLSKIVACIDDHGNPPDYWPSVKDIKQETDKEKKTFRYFLNKPTGDLYKLHVEMGNGFAWNTLKREWTEESFDYISEMEFYEHVEELK